MSRNLKILCGEDEHMSKINGVRGVSSREEPGPTTEHHPQTIYWRRGRAHPSIHFMTDCWPGNCFGIKLYRNQIIRRRQKAAIPMLRPRTARVGGASTRSCRPGSVPVACRRTVPMKAVHVVIIILVSRLCPGEIWFSPPLGEWSSMSVPDTLKGKLPHGIVHVWVA